MDTNVLMFCMVIETILVFGLSPVPSPNKEISEELRRRNRKKSLYILGFHWAVYLFFAGSVGISARVQAYLIAGFMASITLIAGKIKLIIYTKNQERSC